MQQSARDANHGGDMCLNWHDTLSDKTLLTFTWTFISVFALTVNATSANIKIPPAGKSGEMGILQPF